MTSRERFEVWFSSLGHGHVFCRDDFWIAWQAAEAQAVKRCAKIAGFRMMYREQFTTALEIQDAIRTEFSETFK